MSGTAEAGLQLRPYSRLWWFLRLSQRRQRPLEQCSYLLVIGFLRKDSMPLKNAPRVSVDHEYGMVSRIESNRVCGLRSYAVQTE